jgi:hypothetical protein
LDQNRQIKDLGFQLFLEHIQFLLVVVEVLRLMVVTPLDLVKLLLVVERGMLIHLMQDHQVVLVVVLDTMRLPQQSLQQLNQQVLPVDMVMQVVHLVLDPMAVVVVEVLGVLGRQSHHPHQVEEVLDFNFLFLVLHSIMLEVVEVVEQKQIHILDQVVLVVVVLVLLAIPPSQLVVAMPQQIPDQVVVVVVLAPMILVDLDLLVFLYLDIQMLYDMI